MLLAKMKSAASSWLPIPSINSARPRGEQRGRVRIWRWGPPPPAPPPSPSPNSIQFITIFILTANLEWLMDFAKALIRKSWRGQKVVDGGSDFTLELNNLATCILSVSIGNCAKSSVIVDCREMLFLCCFSWYYASDFFLCGRFWTCFLNQKKIFRNFPHHLLLLARLKRYRPAKKLSLRQCT